MNNREIAETFLKMASDGDVKDAYSRFVATHFIHHNQNFNRDQNSLIRAMIKAYQKNHNKSIDIKYT